MAPVPAGTFSLDCECNVTHYLRVTTEFQLTMDDEFDVVVIGAGPIGILSAYFLREGGLSVALVDDQMIGPRSACFANAGLIATHLARPIGMPGVGRRVCKSLFVRKSPFSIKLTALPLLAPWLLQFLMASRMSRVERIASNLNELLSAAWRSYEPVIEKLKLKDCVKRDGVVVAYRSDRQLAEDQFERSLLLSMGIAGERLDDTVLRNCATGLSEAYRVGIRYPGSGHIMDPVRFLRAIGEAFVMAGGVFCPERAVRLLRGASGIRACETTGTRLRAKAFVCAAGAWSMKLCAPLGIRVPLAVERGYSVTVSAPSAPFRTPVVLSDKKFAITPMRSGLRAAGTVELGAFSASPSKNLQAYLSESLQEVLPSLATPPCSHWMGFRPSTPDSLPVIGVDSTAPNLVLAFGHGHLGLTLAAVTGKAVHSLVDGRTPEVDLAACRPQRFY